MFFDWIHSLFSFSSALSLYLLNVWIWLELAWPNRFEIWIADSRHERNTIQSVGACTMHNNISSLRNKRVPSLWMRRRLIYVLSVSWEHMTSIYSTQTFNDIIWIIIFIIVNGAPHKYALKTANHYTVRKIYSCDLRTTHTEKIERERKNDMAWNCINCSGPRCYTYRVVLNKSQNQSRKLHWCYFSSIIFIL